MSTTEQQRLEAEIAAQRAQLADTVDALAAKLDVKAQVAAHKSQLVTWGAAAAVLVVGWVVWKRVRS